MADPAQQASPKGKDKEQMSPPAELPQETATEVIDGASSSNQDATMDEDASSQDAATAEDTAEAAGSTPEAAGKKPQELSSKDTTQVTGAQADDHEGGLQRQASADAEDTQSKEGGRTSDTMTTTQSPGAAMRDTSLEAGSAEGVRSQDTAPAALSLSHDLSAPPAPSKSPATAADDDSEEVEAVARAFGVSATIGEGSSQGEKPPAPSEKEPLTAATTRSASTSSSSTRSGGLRIGKGPPPTTMASEEKPFDFNRFLEQMRHKSAGPVGEYVRSFIKGFTMKPYRAADQTKLIFDFLDFIALRMRECEVWKTATDVEFENATEAMEKLVMNRLYNYTFSPAVRREGKWSVQTDDLERDRVLKQRIKLFGWIEQKHLDVPTGDHSKGFVDFAIQELVKINHYKAPRDKVICILNCCKVIFGLIRHLSSQENADTFIPVLIFVVLRSNPDHLISNVEYISRFRNPDKLSSESGYYLSSLMGAIAFIETMDYTSLSNITQQEFEKNVEEAVAKMGTQTENMDGSQDALDPAQSGSSATGLRTPSPAPPMAHAEESARVLPVSAGATALAEDTRAFFQRTGKAAKAGIGASLGGPMNAIGRLFQEGLEGPRTPSGTSPHATSGRATPESPSPANAMQAPQPTARSRMWNLFGADTSADGRPPRAQSATPQSQQTEQYQQSQASGSSYMPRSRPQQGAARSVSSTAPLSIGSWGRSIRVDPDSEPPTPVSEELQQGHFATLEGKRLHGQRGQLAPGFVGDARGMPSTGLPRRPSQPLRQGSIDPYSVQDEEGMGGVRTPSDDGSITSPTSPANANALRTRLGELGGLLPSFLNDQRQSSFQSSPSNQPRQQGKSTVTPTAVETLPPRLDDEQAERAAAQIDQAHLNASVDTLQSIFPSTDASVCRLVLEGCDGNVQAAIDKLLEMS